MEGLFDGAARMNITKVFEIPEGEGLHVTFGNLDHAFRNRSSICVHPYRMTSLGYWRPQNNALQYSVPLLATQMTLIHVITTFFKFVFDPLQLPPIFSDMLAGILLGDIIVAKYVTLIINQVTSSTMGKTIGRLLKPYKDEQVPSEKIIKDYMLRVFPLRGSGPLGSFATIGFMIFQFLLGVKMDPRMVYNSGRKAAIIGILGVLFPILLCVCLIPILKKLFNMEEEFNQDQGHLEHMFYYISAAHSMTTFPVVATLLTELKILNSDIGRLALSSSMVSEGCNMFIAMILVHYKRFDSYTWDQLKTQSKVQIDGLKKPKTFMSFCENNVWICAPLSSIVYIVGVVLIVRPAVRWVIKRTKKDSPVKETYRILFILAILLSGLVSTAIGQHVLFGPFVLGLAIPDGPPLGTILVSKLESISVMLIPLFITISGLRTTLGKILALKAKFFAMAILVGALTIGKILAVMFPCLYLKMPFNEALALGIIMSVKGIVELSTYNIWRDSEVLNDEAFSTMIVLVGIHAMIVPYLVRALYNPAKKYAGYVRRTILHSKAGAELKVLACINDEENVPTFIKLLSISNPTIEGPIYAYMLHFTELAGRTAPVFISHDEKIISDTNESSESWHFIKAFRNFELQHPRIVKVETFTSISPFITMHDDICTLALNKCTTLVILPFHKQWSADGIMDAQGSSSLRELNKQVLANAPCSVGILVDRGKRLSDPLMRVGLLFLGGADDREALAYAKRMSISPCTSITVIRVVGSQEQDNNEWERMLDKETLKDFKLSTMSNDRVMYKEEVVEDGGETAWIVHAMENEHDLLIVGRRHDSSRSPLLAGLTEWNEFPELGELGDMLASSDVKAAVSVLVIQQMIVRT